MKTIIYYYSGTGNSLWTARLAAAGLGDAEVRPMAGMDSNTTKLKCDAVGLVFPVHIWGVPSLVLRFLDRMENDPSRYYFAFAVNAGQVSRTLIQLAETMETRGLKLCAGFDIVLPSNYIPWGGPGPSEKRDKLYREAREKIKQACIRVSRGESGPIEKGPLWQRIIFTALYKRTFSMVPTMDRSFWVDDKCNGCALCERVCPVGNIAMENEKPVWIHRCEQCLACIQWCPREAIQFGKKTPAYERYHHPEIKMKDIIVRGVK